MVWPPRTTKPCWGLKWLPSGPRPSPRRSTLFSTPHAEIWFVVAEKGAGKTERKEETRLQREGGTGFLQPLRARLRRRMASMLGPPGLRACLSDARPGLAGLSWESGLRAAAHPQIVERGRGGDPCQALCCAAPSAPLHLL